jgi:hypothetical protein
VSIPVELESLAEHIEQFGSIAHLVTVGADSRPHVVSVRVSWQQADLVVGAGRQTSANVTQRPHVTLLWPGAPGGAYALIVDGVAAPVSDAEPALRITPVAAVLHRTPAGDQSAPSCITVLARA